MSSAHLTGTILKRGVPWRVGSVLAVETPPGPFTLLVGGQGHGRQEIRPIHLFSGPRDTISPHLKPIYMTCLSTQNTRRRLGPRRR